MRPSVDLQPDSIFERKNLPRSSHPNGEVQENNANQVKQPLTFPQTVTKLIPLTISCPESGRREVGIIGMQATVEGADKESCENMIDWDVIDKIPIPDAVAIKNPIGECLPTSQSTGSRKLSGEVDMLQSHVECNFSKGEFISPQSPLGSSILLENEAPPSPSTTLVDDESISSDITTVDACILKNRPFESTEIAEFCFLGTEANCYTSQAILNAQTRPETVLQAKRHFMVSSGDGHFTDSTEYYYDTFAIKLQALNSKNSERALCIESYLVQSETEWFRYVQGPGVAKRRACDPNSLACTQRPYQHNAAREVQPLDIEKMDQSVRGPGHHRMTALRSFLLIPIMDFWPVYSLLIGLVRMKPH